MNPKAHIFFDAITLLPEDIVEEAQDYRFRKKQSGWKKVGSLAACLALIVSLSLLMLPRGCGAGGGNADMNSSGAPAASADTSPQEPPLSGEPAPEPSETPGAYPADSPEGGYGFGQVETEFTAVVLEIGDGFILVEPLEGEHIQGLYTVSAINLELPELAVGDKVRITYDGLVLDTDPAQILGTVAIELLEED